MPGTFFYKTIFAIVQFVAPSFGISEGRHTIEKNRTLEPDISRGPITDQSQLSEMNFGETNVGKSGCEAVALYNTLLLKNKPKALSRIIEDLQVGQTLVNRGNWGTNPFGMARIMSEYGLDYEIMETEEEAEEKMKAGDMLIVTVWNRERRPLQGIHGYVIQKVEEGRFLSFNKTYGPYPEKSSNLRDAIGQGSYIVGYLVR